MVITPPIQLGTIGMDDTLVLMVLALVLLGPRRLPQVGRQIGKLMYEFRKASNDFKYQLEEELRNAEDADRRKREDAERQRTLTDAQNAVVQAQSAAEKALEAATLAQNAAQAAQTAAAESTTAAESMIADAPSSADTSSPDTPAPDTIDTPASAAAENAEMDARPIAIASLETVETTLRIQPPTTGEQVAAERPGRATIEAPADTAAASGHDSLLKKDVDAEESSAATEPTIHHG